MSTVNQKILAAIVAMDRQGAIGLNGDLLCHLPADLRHFKQLTMGHSIVMGRRTFLSLPKGALPGRQNIVLSRQDNLQLPGALVVPSIEHALDVAEMPGEVFILGGGEVYRQTIDYVNRLYITRIENEFAQADTYFPAIIPSQWTLVAEEAYPADDRNPFAYTFLTYHRH